MNPPATRDHVIAATHFVLGPTNFLVLRLPGNWDLRIGRNPSDIDYMVEFDGVRWAREGQATAFLIDEKAKRAMELDVRTAKGALRAPALESVQEGSCEIGGHPATYRLGETRLGLRKNKPFHVLHVTYRCEETRRSITMKFLARSEPSELAALLPVMAGSRCH
ncbi:MAG TPA: hypothetical protein VEY12_06265 [Thermoplasmata archaeon]|nr:hypothetical protein [Thermoplasmata archaeon]